MDTITISFLIIIGIALSIAFIIEIYILYSHKESFKTWTSIMDEYSNSFSELKLIINSNANLLRIVGETLNEQDRTIKVMSVIVDLHSEILKLDPSLKGGLINPPINEYVLEINNDVD